MGTIKQLPTPLEPASMQQLQGQTQQQEEISEASRLVLPAMMIPSFRTSLAIKRGVERKILMQTWGGLGDQICTEPTLRYAIEAFPTCELYLASQCQELFAHLPFKKVWNLREEQPIWENFFTFNTIYPPQHLQWEFMSHMITHCVDYASLTAFRCQLPVASREVIIKPKQEAFDAIEQYLGPKDIAIHAGKHWESKTFPNDWWDAVLAELVSEGFRPVLVGADTDDNRTTVDVNVDGCLDLRNKTKVMECIALLQRSKVLLTNDSSPLHMAVTGDAWIGFIATCKHFDYITHWRKGKWGWRQQNLGLGGMWEVMDFCPNKENEITVDKVDAALLRSWLPDPVAYAQWGMKKHGEY